MQCSMVSIWTVPLRSDVRRSRLATFSTTAGMRIGRILVLAHENDAGVRLGGPKTQHRLLAGEQTPAGHLDGVTNGLLRPQVARLV